MAAVLPYSGTPVEWIWALGPDVPVKIEDFRGYVLTFPPDPRYRTPEGRSRRLEWVDPATARKLVDPQGRWCRGGQAPSLRIAEDLLQQEQAAHFAQQIEAAVGATFVRQEEVAALRQQLADTEQALKLLLPAVRMLQAQVKDLQEQNAVPARRKPGPKLHGVELASEPDTPGSTDGG